MTCQHYNLHPPTPSYCTSSPSLCPPPLPPSITGPDRQEWPCMTTNCGAFCVLKTACMEKTQVQHRCFHTCLPLRFFTILLYVIQAKTAVKLGPPAPSISFSSSSIKPQPTSIVTLASNMTPDLVSHTMLSNQQELREYQNVLPKECYPIHFFVQVKKIIGVLVTEVSF